MAPEEAKLTEKFIHWVWQHQLLKKGLKTESGKPIRVIEFGTLNQEDGPDFKHACIKFDRPMSGDIEVHLHPDSWFEHGHELDPKYNNVILHVVAQESIQVPITQSGITVETLNISKWFKSPFPELLKDYNKEVKYKENVICPYVPEFKRCDLKSLLNVLEIEGINRFNERENRFDELIRAYNREQAVYTGIMESLGYVKNEAPFRKLAGLVSIESIIPLVTGKRRKERVKILKVSLLGAAGLLSQKFQKRSYLKVWEGIKDNFESTMKAEDWQFFKVRPPSFPSKRIEEISYFLADMIQEGICDFLINTFPDLEKIKEKLGEGGISKSCSRTIILNVCLPVLSILCEGQREEIIQIYREYKPLPANNITKLMSNKLSISRRKRSHLKRSHLKRSHLKLDKEIYYQGMIHIFKHHCHREHCDDCPVKLKFS